METYANLFHDSSEWNSLNNNSLATTETSIDLDLPAESFSETDQLNEQEKFEKKLRKQQRHQSRKAEEKMRIYRETIRGSGGHLLDKNGIPQDRPGELFVHRNLDLINH